MKLYPVIVVAVALSVLGATLGFVALSEPAPQSQLTKFASEAELNEFLRDRAGSEGTTVRTVDNAEAAPTSAYSKTNVQVEGVDEGDKVKTDGVYLFIADRNAVKIISAAPPMANVSAVTIGSSDQAYVQSIYLYEHRLVILYSIYNIMISYGGIVADQSAYYGTVERTCVAVFDVSDPSHPAKVGAAEVTGYSMTSRMIGSALYLVTQQSAWAGDQVELPIRSVNGEEKAVAATEISYDPAIASVNCFINLLAFDVVSGKCTTLTALAGSASVAYMSPTALYLAVQIWGKGGTWSMGSSETSTAIYRVEVRGTEMALTSRGEVKGSPINQFALDESKGRLRVATTTGWPNPESQVHILELNLTEVGSLTAIAPGESIFACRFMGDRLYLVTFLQVDPLFIIDLSSDHPSILGQLKVPGASNYLQMTERGLIGIGFENGSLKAALFDVRDPGDMREVGHYVAGDFSFSAAQYDHRAVLYIPPGVLVIPLTTYGKGGWGVDDQTAWVSYMPQSSALVLRVDGSGMHELGMIVHENATVERSLYIGSTLYTISDTTVIASSLEDLSTIGVLTYGEGNRYLYGGGGAEPAVLSK